MSNEKFQGKTNKNKRNRWHARAWIHAYRTESNKLLCLGEEMEKRFIRTTTGKTFLTTLVFFNTEKLFFFKFLETVHNCVFQHIPSITLFQLCSALLMSTILTLQLFPTQKFSCNTFCVFRTDEHYAYLTHFTAVHTINIHRHYTFSALFSVAHIHYSQPPSSSLDKNTEP